MSTTYQQRYWSMLVEARVHMGYLYHYGTASEWMDKLVNIFLAVASSSSIAAWAIWHEFTWVWPTLIAGSQVITAIKPFLPYNQRIKAVSVLNDSYQSICLQMENVWFSVSEGMLSDQQIHDEIIKFRTILMEAERKALDGTPLPRKQKFMDKAEADAERYFEAHYQV